MYINFEYIQAHKIAVCGDVPWRVSRITGKRKKRKRAIDPLLLECVTHFHINTRTKGIVVGGIGAQVEACRERERLDPETGSDGGVETESMAALDIGHGFPIDDVIIVIIDIVPVVVVPEVKRRAGGDVDERLQLAPSVKVVAEVEEHGNALAVCGVDGIADTNTKQRVGTVKLKAVDENTVETYRAATINAVLIDHVV